jgi:hypothetical protein
MNEAISEGSILGLFLTAMRDHDHISAKQARQRARLFKLTSENPHAVKKYLNSLPPEDVVDSELLSTLQKLVDVYVVDAPETGQTDAE